MYVKESIGRNNSQISKVAARIKRTELSVNPSIIGSTRKHTGACDNSSRICESAERDVADFQLFNYEMERP